MNLTQPPPSPFVSQLGEGEVEWRQLCCDWLTVISSKTKSGW
jgi:hypothetical protein